MYSIYICLVVWLVFCAAKFDRTTGLYAFDRATTIPLRAVLAMAVVLGHLAVRTECDFGVLRYFLWHRYAVCVFFFMSGYGMFVSVMNKGDAYLRGMVSRTIIKLFLPLGLIMLGMATYALLIGNFNLMAVTRSYMSGQTALCPHSWYVFELFALSIVFATSASMAKSNKGIFVLCSVGALLLYVVIRYVLQWPGWWWESIFAFPVGVAYAGAERKIVAFIKRFGRNVYIGVAVALSLIGLLKFCVHGGSAGALLESALGGVVAVCFYVLPLPQWKWLSSLGCVSYELYLVHGIVRNYIDRHLCVMNSNLRGVAIILATIFAAYIFHVVLLLLRKGNRR